MVAFRWKCLTAIPLVLALSTAAAYSETITVHGQTERFRVVMQPPSPDLDRVRTLLTLRMLSGGTGGDPRIGYPTNGGNAAATATTSITSGAASAYGNATGGDGGGFESTGFIVVNGGNGGSATATATASTSGSTATASVCGERRKRRLSH
jgi:hypothetical protein